MADRVIIVGFHRGGTKVPITEMMQMQGRCARKAGQCGVVDIIVGESEVEEVEAAMKDAEELAVASTLDCSDEIVFHLVSEIANRNVTTIQDVKSWHERSFAAFSGSEIDLDEVLTILIESEAVVKRGNFLFPTEIGRIASGFYFHPVDVFRWRQNFREVLPQESESAFCLAWAIATVPHQKVYIGGYSHYVEEYTSQVLSMGLDPKGATALGIVWWSLLGGPSLGKCAETVRNVKEDAPRVIAALQAIGKADGWDRSLFERLAVRMKYRISEELVKLCSLDGITKAMAQELYSLGIQNPEDILTEWAAIEAAGTDELIIALQEKGYGE